MLSIWEWCARMRHFAGTVTGDTVSDRHHTGEVTTICRGITLFLIIMRVATYT
jgi:hypothetical protein